MQVERTSENVLEIDLAGTPVNGTGNPHHGEGVIELTPYGAKRFAYELLLEATDAEWYASHTGTTKRIERLLKKP